MNYLNILVPLLRSAEYVGSDPIQRGTWLSLLGYCAEQENGGVITGCRDWKDRRWQQTCGVTKSEVEQECDLWSWSGDDLTVWEYPRDKEETVRTRRENARENGKSGGRRKTNTGSNDEPPPDAAPQPVPAPAPKPAPLATYSDSMPLEAADDMLNLESRIQSLRPGWRTAMSYAEQQAIVANRRCLESIDDAGWQTIKDYLVARLPEGMPGYQPRSRSRFINDVADVYNHAFEWRRKQAERRPAIKPQAQAERRNLSREELAEVFKTTRS